MKSKIEWERPLSSILNLLKNQTAPEQIHNRHLF